VILEKLVGLKNIKASVGALVHISEVGFIPEFLSFHQQKEYFIAL